MENLFKDFHSYKCGSVISSWHCLFETKPYCIPPCWSEPGKSIWIHRNHKNWVTVQSQSVLPYIYHNHSPTFSVWPLQNNSKTRSIITPSSVSSGHLKSKWKPSNPSPAWICSLGVQGNWTWGKSGIISLFTPYKGIWTTGTTPILLFFYV